MEYKDNHILRLIHFDNLEDTLKNGMYSKNSGHVIPNYTIERICGLIVLNQEHAERAKLIQQKIGIEIPIYVDTPRKYFYP